MAEMGDTDGERRRGAELLPHPLDIMAIHALYQQDY